MADELQADAAEIERAPAPDTPRSERVRLLTLEHLDGRTLAAKRVRDIEASLIADGGGMEHVSTARRALTRRAALLCAVLEDHEARWAAGEVPFNPELYLPGVNALGRVLERIGLDRKAVPVRTLQDHLRVAGA